MTVRSAVSTAGVDRRSLLPLGALAIALTAVVGPAGFVAAVGVGVLRYTLEVPAALAGGHVALVALFPGGIDPLSFALVEVGFLLVLIEAVSGRSRPLRVATVAVVSALALGGVAWVALSHSVWLAATTLVVLFGVAAYGAHRYEIVRARQLSEDGEPPPTGGQATARDVEPTDTSSGANR